jgi:hypothetical protein
MAKLDYKGLASGLKLSTEKDDPEGKADGGADEATEGDAEKPGSLGSRAISAIKAGNGEAFEEAIKQICGQ